MKIKNVIRRIIQAIVLIVGIAMLYLGGIILVGTFTDYRPEPVTELEIQGESIPGAIGDSTLTFLTWNIGFCGLGAEMDFFYDGGEMVWPTSEQVKNYTAGVLDFLQSVDSIGFILLQEVDKNSARTREQDEIMLIAEKMKGYTASFGTNYKVKFVPLPFTNPLGKVEMGQMNLSKYQPESSQRFSFFSAYSWPKRLFMLDRCFVVSRFRLVNGKELVLMNTHNSAYDVGGKLRNMEMPLIRDLMLEEYNKGNYVVAGGDWNQNPPGFEPAKVDPAFPAVKREILERSLFPAEWQFVFDPQKPTNREIDAPLTPGKTEVTVIDYFILSPNLQAEKIEVIRQNFKNSDHEPVFMKIKIRE